MTNTKPATPLPWATHKQYSDRRVEFGTVDLNGDGDYSGEGYTPQDAAYIVAACNAYPELVAALRELHAIDERKLIAVRKRPYAIGAGAVDERVRRNRALLARLGEDK